ncbi:MAG: methyltransferase domain-containing protein [Anaerolineae bacterium]|nr:methyltransferase domain-containing protein [Anaerolineae bacterium]
MTLDNWNIPGSTVEIYQDIFIPAMIGEWVPRMLALVDLQPGEKVLDVACGTGVITRAAAEAVGTGGAVTGIDISPDMLSLARKLTDGRFPSVDWHECDAQGLPFEEGMFDSVICQLGLMFIPDKVAALKEMLRVLKTNGRVAVMVWGAIEKCSGQTAMAKTWEKLFGKEQAAGFYRQHSMSDPQMLRSILEAAGYCEIEIQSSMGTMRFPSVEILVRAYGALGKFPANPSEQALAIQEVEQALQEFMGSQGLVYPIEAVLGKARKG